MKRTTIMLLLGASVMLASDAEAQRARERGNERGSRAERGGRVERLDPVRAPGRIAPQRHRVVRSHRYGQRGRVVYTTRNRYRNYGWHRVNRRDFGHVVFRAPFYGRRPYLTQRELKDVLGNRAVRVVKDAGRRAGLRGSVRGHWVHEYGRRSTLVVTMDRVDIAEFVDFDGDGYVDDLFLIGPAGNRRVARGW